MASRRVVGCVLLLAVGLTTAGLLLFEGECSEECPPDCGDCLACGLMADHPAVPTLAAGLAVGSLRRPGHAFLPAFLARQLDHVPLRALA
jgi:hypothetical protein